MTNTCAECKIEFDGRPYRGYCSRACYFWARVDKSAGPDSCWLWTGASNPVKGYGVLQEDRQCIGAHRQAYKLHYGVDPGEMCICHRCDVRRCCNPRHLFLGTRRDNWWDAVQKGRVVVTAPGEANPRAKLTADEAAAIRRSAARVRDLVRAYGVSRRTISYIRAGRTWRHVADDVPIAAE